MNSSTCPPPPTYHQSMLNRNATAATESAAKNVDIYSTASTASTAIGHVRFEGNVLPTTQTAAKSASASGSSLASIPSLPSVPISCVAVSTGGCTTGERQLCASSYLPPIQERARYSDFEAVLLAVEELRKSTGMNKSHLYRHSAKTFTPADAMDAFGVPMYDPCEPGVKPHNFPRRFSYRCNHKKANGEPCPFYLPFSWLKEHGEYKYTIASGMHDHTKLCLTHNHSVFRGNEIDGRVLVGRQCNL